MTAAEVQPVDVYCPLCSAAPGTPCGEIFGGGDMAGFHLARVELAERRAQGLGRPPLVQPCGALFDPTALADLDVTEGDAYLDQATGRTYARVDGEWAEHKEAPAQP